MLALASFEKSMNSIASSWTAFTNVYIDKFSFRAFIS